MIEYLPWDSNFFHKKIGKIFVNSGNESNLEQLIENAINEQYQLLYLFTPENIIIEYPILNKFSGKLVDKKVLYTQNIEGTNVFIDSPIEEYLESKLSNDLESLSYLSGSFSRFHVDKNFNNDDFYRLYKTWIIKSLKKEICDKIFVLKEIDEILGMVTLKYGDQKGEIGLIAVAESAQGKNIGKNLINVCIKDLISKNIFKIEVPTQFENLAACRFYEKCNFEIKNITNIYHFWL